MAYSKEKIKIILASVKKIGVDQTSIAYKVPRSSIYNWLKKDFKVPEKLKKSSVPTGDNTINLVLKRIYLKDKRFTLYVIKDLDLNLDFYSFSIFNSHLVFKTFLQYFFYSYTRVQKSSGINLYIKSFTTIKNLKNFEVDAYSSKTKILKADFKVNITSLKQKLLSTMSKKEDILRHLEDSFFAQFTNEEANYPVPIYLDVTPLPSRKDNQGNFWKDFHTKKIEKLLKSYLDRNEINLKTGNFSGSENELMKIRLLVQKTSSLALLARYFLQELYHREMYQSYDLILEFLKIYIKSNKANTELTTLVTIKLSLQYFKFYDWENAIKYYNQLTPQIIDSGTEVVTSQYQLLDLSKRIYYNEVVDYEKEISGLEKSLSSAELFDIYTHYYYKLQNQNKTEEAHKLLNKLKFFAKSDIYLKARLLRFTGYLKFNQGNSGEAFRDFISYNELTKEYGFKNLFQESRGQLALIYKEKGNLKAAYKEAQSLYAYGNITNNQFYKYKGSLLLTTILVDQNRLKKALNYAKEQLSFSEFSQYSEFRNSALNNLIFISLKMNDLKNAKKYLNRLIKLSKKSGNKRRIIQNLLHLGYLETKSLKTKEALKTYFKANKMAQKENYYQLTYISYADIAVLKSKQMSFRSALYYINKALDMATNKSAISELPRLNLIKAKIYLNSGEVIKGHGCLESAKNLAIKMGNKTIISKCLKEEEKYKEFLPF